MTAAASFPTRRWISWRQHCDRWRVCCGESMSPSRWALSKRQAQHHLHIAVCVFVYMHIGTVIHLHVQACASSSSCHCCSFPCCAQLITSPANLNQSTGSPQSHMPWFVSHQACQSAQHVFVYRGCTAAWIFKVPRHACFITATCCTDLLA